MSGTEVVHFLKAIDKETLKSTVVAVSNLPPNVRDLEEIMRPTIIAWLNSPKDKRGVYGGVPENVPEDEPQTAYNLLRWLGHCSGTKNGLLRKLFWAICASDNTLVAKGHGQQEFLDLFGIKNDRVYKRLVSSVVVGQRTGFNPTTLSDTSPVNAPFQVEQHSGVEFDELEPNSDLFTELIAKYPSQAPTNHNLPWIVSANSSEILIAKGRGQQEFLDLFGIKDKRVYKRLVSSVVVGQRTGFNPTTLSDTSPVNAPFQVEQHSGVEFDELEPNSDLFTELTNENNLCYSHHQSSLPTKCIGEYDVVIPKTPDGLLLNVGEVKGKDGCIAFFGYRQFPNGSKGPAELKNLIRYGDIIIAVNGHSIVRSKWKDSLAKLKQSASFAFLRLIPPECIENGHTSCGKY